MDLYDGGHHRLLLVAPATLFATMLAGAAWLLPHTAAAQPALVYGFCNTAQYSPNDSFSHNLNTVVRVLTQSASNSLYSFAASDPGPSDDSYVYAMYQCRGDASFSACSSCVSHAFNICGPAIGARGQYEACFIRYENYNFSAGLLQASSPPAVAPACSAAQDSSPLYQRNLASALTNSASAAPRHPLFGYDASSVGTGSTRAFALTQCLGYLSPSQCAACLSNVSNYSTQCNNSVSGQVYYDQCYYVYNHTSFLFTSHTATPPSNAPAPAPMVSSRSSRVPASVPGSVASSKAPAPVPVPVPVASTTAPASVPISMAPPPVPTTSFAPIPAPVPSTIPAPVSPSPTHVLSPLQPSWASSLQEKSKKGNAIISIVVILVASSFYLTTLL